MQARVHGVILTACATLLGAAVARAQAPAASPSAAASASASAAASAAASATPSPAASPRPSPTGPQPKVVLVDPIHDFGIQPTGTKLVWEFTLRNEGATALQITDVKPSCACTVVSFDKSIAAGASGRVRAEFDTTGMSGATSKQLTVLTSDPTNPILTLTLQATLRPHFAAQPDYMRFILVEGEAAQSQASTLGSPDFDDLQVTKVTSPYPFLKVTAREAHGDEHIIGIRGRQWRLEASLDPTGPTGPLAKMILVDTNHPQQKTFELPVTGFVRPVIAVTPSVADLGKVPANEPFRKNIKVQNFGTEPVDFTRVECTVPGVTVELQPTRQGHVYLVWVTLGPKMHKGDFAGTISVYSSNPKHPKVDIALRGTLE